MREEGTLEFGHNGVVRVSGALGFESCAVLYRAMERHLAGGGAPRQIDLENVTSIDSAGLALLLEWKYASRNTGEELQMTGASSSLVQFARLSEAAELLDLPGKESP